MSEQPYMPFWIGKFVADTMHLSGEETGAYIMLLGAMWMRGGTLLDDREGLCRIARVSPKRWTRVWKTLKPFFTFNDDGTFTQKRLASEYLVASEKRLSKAQNAASGWRKRRSSDSGGVTNKNNDIADAPALQPQCDSNVSHTHTHLVSTDTKNNSRAKRGSTIPPNWKPSEDDLLWASGQNYPLSFVESQTEAMRLWAEANSNRAVARKADWSKTWKGWLRREWPRWQKASGPPDKSRTMLAADRVLAKIKALENDPSNTGTSPQHRPLLIGQSSESSARPGRAAGTTGDAIHGQALRLVVEND